MIIIFKINITDIGGHVNFICFGATSIVRKQNSPIKAGTVHAEYDQNDDCCVIDTPAENNVLFRNALSDPDALLL